MGGKRLISFTFSFLDKLTVMIDKQGQKTVAAKIQQPSQESVMIKPDSTILVDGKQADCSQKACQSKQGGATVVKVQQPDGKTQIQLSTKVRYSLFLSYTFLSK